MKVINARPAKRFFVDMLIRDIDINDAILDLLDNCVDGVQRQIFSTLDAKKVKPYEGYWAKLTLHPDQFKIIDNCGGISEEIAIESAFRMGKPQDEENRIATVGMYGIGMKRAIFKMGRNAVIQSRHKSQKFRVTIDKSWMEHDEWDLSLEADTTPLSEAGTSIAITSLRPESIQLFAEKTMIDDLKAIIRKQYAVILKKGFKVTVNGEDLVPEDISLIGTNQDTSVDPGNWKRGIEPYCYKNTIGSIQALLYVGLYRDVITDEEEDVSKDGHFSSESAGISIICNDRVVVYNDRTKITGWGVGPVPQYHTQFIAIRGVLILNSTNPTDLPLTTTKRGIDGNSPLYLELKNYLMEGIRTFTNYTNNLKKSSLTVKDVIGDSPKTFNPVAVKHGEISYKFKAVSSQKFGGEKYKPDLPLPRDQDPLQSIKFYRRESEIRDVDEFLFGGESSSNAKVGESCFDIQLKKARGRR